jgi:hypothetical protein
MRRTGETAAEDEEEEEEEEDNKDMAKEQQTSPFKCSIDKEIICAASPKIGKWVRVRVRV